VLLELSNDVPHRPTVAVDSGQQATDLVDQIRLGVIRVRLDLPDQVGESARLGPLAPSAEDPTASGRPQK
jgi:hypothetical protein